jgi:hypothetical protein
MLGVPVAIDAVIAEIKYNSIYSVNSRIGSKTFQLPSAVLEKTRRSYAEVIIHPTHGPPRLGIRVTKHFINITFKN